METSACFFSGGFRASDKSAKISYVGRNKISLIFLDLKDLILKFNKSIKKRKPLCQFNRVSDTIKICKNDVI